MITAAQENERMLARILGISEEEAAQKLYRKVCITHAGGESAIFARELREQIERTVHVVDDATCDLEVIVGAIPRGVSRERLFIWSQPDGVFASRTAPSGQADMVPLHGLQTMIAACLACGVVLHRLIDQLPVPEYRDPFTIRFDALGATRSVLEAPIIVKDTVLIGAGGVANGFLRGARHLTIQGELEVTDPKLVGSGNPNRCLYFDQNDVGHPKAQRLCDKAQPDFQNLRLKPLNQTFSKVAATKGRVRRVLVTTDSRPVRRSIQKELPLEVLDASTTEASEVVVHSHRQPTSGACLACIYRHIPDENARAKDIANGLGIDVSDVISGELISERVAHNIARTHPTLSVSALVGVAFDSLFKQLCGEQALRTPTGAQVLAPFAFVSNLAGALLALELARFDSPAANPTQSNYLNLSPWSSPHARVRSRRAREPDCEFCSRSHSMQTLRLVWPEYRL